MTKNILIIAVNYILFKVTKNVFTLSVYKFNGVPGLTTSIVGPAYEWIRFEVYLLRITFKILDSFK